MNKEKTYPVYSITRSYSRKVSANYQTTDYFASRSYSWFVEPSKEEIIKKSGEIYQECKNEIELAIREQEIKKNLANKAKEESRLSFDLDLQGDLEKEEEQKNV